MRKISLRAAATLAMVVLALGLAPGAARAQQIELEIGPVTVCHLVTFFDIVIFEYDCHTGG